MNKSVLISIRPRWIEKIARGEKTIEVRKTRPKLAPPFKCYIYQTLPKYGDWNEWDGRVVGEFVCDAIFQVTVFDNGSIQNWNALSLDEACVSYEDMAAYIGDGKQGYGWHISELKFYEKPKALSKFKRWNRTEDNAPCAHTKWLYEPCDTCKECNLTRPPQSWSYVEGD